VAETTEPGDSTPLSVSRWTKADRDLPTSVREVQLQLSARELPSLMRHFWTGFEPLVLVNLKRAGWPVADRPGLYAELGNSVIEHAPAEILAEDSLHLVRWNTESPGALDQLDELLRRDAALAIRTAWTIGEVIENKKLYWGWLLRPSGLRFHLLNGTEGLAPAICCADFVVLGWSAEEGAYLIHGPAQTVEAVVGRPGAAG